MYIWFAVIPYIISTNFAVQILLVRTCLAVYLLPLSRFLSFSGEDFLVLKRTVPLIKCYLGVGWERQPGLLLCLIVDWGNLSWFLQKFCMTQYTNVKDTSSIRKKTPRSQFGYIDLDYTQQTGRQHHKNVFIHNKKDSLPSSSWTNYDGTLEKKRWRVKDDPSSIRRKATQLWPLSLAPSHGDPYRTIRRLCCIESSCSSEVTGVTWHPRSLTSGSAAPFAQINSHFLPRT